MKNKNLRNILIGGAIVAAVAIAPLVSQQVINGTGQNVTITSDAVLTGNFATVTVRAGSVIGTDAIIQCLRITGNDVTFSGGEVTGCSSHGVLINSQNVVVERLYVHDNVTENGRNGSCPGTGGWGSGIKVQVGGQNVVIRDNYVYSNCGEGIGITRGLNITVQGNYVRDNFSVNIYMDNSPNSQAVNNTVWCTGTHLRNGSRPNGIASAEESYTGWGTQRHDVTIAGNYIADCNDGISSWKSELSTGAEIRLLVEGNKVINSVRSIKLDSPTNQSVVVRENFIEKPITVRNMVGVTLENNAIAPVERLEIVPPTLGGAMVISTPSVTAIASSTPTATRTLVFTATPTRTPTPTSTFLPAIPATPTPRFDPRCDAKYLPFVCVYIP